MTNQAKIQKAELMQPCPCESGIIFENCCQPYLLGLQKAETAEVLLRARYSAFVSGNIDYIIETHHPEKRNEIDRNSVSEWAKGSQWHGLNVLSVVGGAATDSEGTIEFIAKYTQDGKSYEHRECSLFKKHDGAWYFFDIAKNLPIKNTQKIGANDPCFCGSGKKYKKCHAA